MAYLVLIRHTESLWNAQGLWTGWTDIELSQEGREKAYKLVPLLNDIQFQKVFTSNLKRAEQTWEEINRGLGNLNIPVIKSEALNERNYGQYTGKNKWEIEEKFGKEQFLKLRRGWNEPIPQGETLKDVYERVVPYYLQNIFPELKDGENILIVAHGNSLRALIKYLENISDQDIPNLEIPIGTIYFYEIDNQGKIINKRIHLD